jgi:cyclopropane-fatty-acyl-phospholipid synthase
MENASEKGAAAAAAVLARIFRNVPFGFAAKLWDGARVHLGGGGEPFTLVFRDRETFRRLMLRPNTLRFATAYVDGDLDVEGDLFTAIRLANRIEELRLSLADRMVILSSLAKL